MRYFAEWRERRTSIIRPSSDGANATQSNHGHTGRERHLTETPGTPIWADNVHVLCGIAFHCRRSQLVRVNGSVKKRWRVNEMRKPRMEADASRGLSGDALYFGRMSGPTGSGFLKGLCGEEMEFYLYIRNGILEDVKYYTEGCDDTRTCALAVAKRAKGTSVMDALAINPREIVDSLEGLSEQARHCAILAVSTLYRAIADYLLKP